MIQLAMVFALGALAASLLALAVIPAVGRRAERRARAALERRLPLSLPEIAAERDQLRAAHAVEVRRWEQRAEGLNERLAGLLSEAGRQGSRMAMLDQRSRADASAIADYQAALAQASRTIRDNEATLGAQALVLHDAYMASERRRDLLAVATARLGDAESLVADQRAIIAELEQVLAGRGARIVAEGAQAARVTDDMVQLRASFGRLRSEHDILRRGHDTMTSEREKLRFRIDELLLRVEELQEEAEETGETVQDQRRRLARQDQTIATLTTRIAAREEALGTVKRLLADETSRRKAIENSAAPTTLDPDPPEHGGYSRRQDAAALRLAISALAADLVRSVDLDDDSVAAEETSRPAAGTH